MKRPGPLAVVALMGVLSPAAPSVRAQSSKEGAIAAGKAIFDSQGIDLDRLPPDGAIDRSKLSWPRDLTRKDKDTLDLILRLDPRDDGERKIQKLSEVLRDPDANREDVEEFRRLLDERGIFDPWALPANPTETGPAILQRWEAVKLPGQIPPPALALLQEGAARQFVDGCGPAAKRWAALRDELPRLEADEVETVAAATTIIRDYADKCLATPDSLAPARRQYLDALVGVITFANDPGLYRCTGTRLSATTVLTARHCLFATPKSDAGPIGLGLLKFVLAGAPDSPLAILGVRQYPSGLADRNHFDEEGDPFDWVILDIATSGVAFPGVATGSPAEFEALNVYGFQKALAVAEDVERRHARRHGTPIPATPWTAKMRVDRSPACLVAATVRDACFIHACQSDVGSSGSPVFRVEGNGGLTLVGMHIRSRRASESSACASVLLPTIPNIALVAPVVASAAVQDPAR